jgi:hypothetical protein
MMHIPVDFFAQNPFGHLDPLLAGCRGRTAAQLSKILGMDKQSPDEKNIGDFLSDALHDLNAKIQGFDHFGLEPKNRVKRILPGTGDVEAKFVVVERIEFVVFLIVHFFLRKDLQNELIENRLRIGGHAHAPMQPPHRKF